jgi:hypothetical protein
MRSVRRARPRERAGRRPSCRGCSP